MINKLDNLREARRKGQSGFTIIEVLIVLAIAGLIMLVVFLAVPALQRNSRNTSRKNDVGRVGGAVTEFISNNNGKIPVAGDVTTIQNQVGNLSQYTTTPYIVVATGVQGAYTSLTQMRLVTGAKCDPATAGATIAGTSRQMALQYAVENSSGNGVGVCQEI